MQTTGGGHGRIPRNHICVGAQVETDRGHEKILLAVAGAPSILKMEFLSFPEGKASLG
jgi:hypothetical protein